MRALLQKIRIVRAFIKLIQDPKKTDMVFKISDSGRARNNPSLEDTIRHINSCEGFQEIFNANYNPTLPALEELAGYPEGTLGREFARHMQANGLAIDFYPTERRDGVVAYIVNRSRKMHDLWHVITGFGISVEDEVGLQAFTLMQLRSPLSGILVASGLLHSALLNPAVFHRMLSRITTGFEMGKACKALIGVRLEDKLHVPVQQLRKEFGIQVGVEMLSKVP